MTDHRRTPTRFPRPVAYVADRQHHRRHREVLPVKPPQRIRHRRHQVRATAHRLASPRREPAHEMCPQFMRNQTGVRSSAFVFIWVHLWFSSAWAQPGLFRQLVKSKRAATQFEDVPVGGQLVLQARDHRVKPLLALLLHFTTPGSGRPRSFAGARANMPTRAGFATTVTLSAPITFTSTGTSSPCVGAKPASTSSPITASADPCQIRPSEPEYLPFAATPRQPKGPGASNRAS